MPADSGGGGGGSVWDRSGPAGAAIGAEVAAGQEEVVADSVDEDIVAAAAKIFQVDAV